MLDTHVDTWKCLPFIKCFVLGAMFLTPTLALASDLGGHMTQGSQTESEALAEAGEEQLSPGHRQVEGTVEAVNENTIRVKAGEAGAISPRYLDLDNTKGNHNIKTGDHLKIEVNAQNKVVKFKKIDAQSSSQKKKSAQ